MMPEFDLTTFTQARRSNGSTLTPVALLIYREVRRELTQHDAVSSHSHNDERWILTVIGNVAERLGFELTSIERDEILLALDGSRALFGVLQPLVDDAAVSDIIVSGFSRVTVQRGRRNFTTGISFPDQLSYESFIERLLQRAGTAYSTKRPIADGMIGEAARLHVVHSTLSENGPYLTIRLNRFKRVRVENLVHAGLAPARIFDYLGGMIHAGRTILVTGEVGTGKTTLVRALASAISPEESILVIEDTPEIRLDHPHVRYLTTREANSEGAGRVSPSECIRGGMRMAMNRIVFGEMRDAEAAEAFVDVCASGHPGLSTIHARSALDAVIRLELFLGRAQKGIAAEIITSQIASAVQCIVHLDLCRDSGRRRISSVVEVGPVADGCLRHRELFRYQMINAAPIWKVVSRVSAHRESLERLSDPIELSSFPNLLEIGGNEFREAASGASSRRRSA